MGRTAGVSKDSHSRDRPAVTIIVTTYNRAGLVPRAIESVLGQTYPNVDLVVVDDGSTDDTREVLAQYDDDPRVRIVRHDRNRGTNAAKNTGLSALPDACTLFGMLDSDDTLTPDAVDIVARVFEDKGEHCSIVFGWGRAVPSGAPTGQMVHLTDGQGEVTYSDALAGFYRGDFWHLARRDLLGAMRFEERASRCCGSVWWRLLRAAPGWLVPDVVLNVDTTGADRLSIPPDYRRRSAVGMMWSEQAMLDAVGEDLRRHDPRTYGQWLTELAKWAALAGDGPRARLASRRAVRLAPSPRSIGMALLAIAPEPLVGLIAAVRARVRYRVRTP
jgi:glycosyltransferase involved in cell wall biosynthesis